MILKKKPKTILIFPPSTVYFGDPTIPAVTPPLGLAYLAAYLEKYRYPVAILDAVVEGKIRKYKKKTVYGLSEKEILERIKKFAPDLVGIACMYTAYAGDAHRVAKIVKDYNPKIPVIFGGAHASIFPELILKDKNVDLVVLGEGELTILDLVRHLEAKKPLTELPGTVARIRKKIIRNNPRVFIEDLDAIPFPAWHLMPMKTYIEAGDSDYAMRRPGMVIISSRGCPGRCIYCSIHAVWGHTWRGRSSKNVADELEKLHQDYGIREFYFMDDSMGVSKPRLKEICQEIIQRKLDIRWTTPNGIAHWTLDEEVLDRMKAAGCYRITFGIESGNPETRRFIGKPYDLSQAERMIKYANKIGLWTICTNIIGFPDETREQIEDTIKFAIDSDTDLAIFYLLCPHPGTKAYEIFKEKGLVNFDYVFEPKRGFKSEDFAEIGRALAGRGVRTKYFSEEELREILTKAYRRFVLARCKSFLKPRRIIQKIHSQEDLFYVSRIGLQGLKALVGLLKNKTGFTSHGFRRDST